jgi:hypothetical protein
MIEREVPGDTKQPSPHITFWSLGDRGPAYAQEDVLRQIARRLGLADGAEEIPE